VSASRFQHFLAIDWSGAQGERHKGIAMALAQEAGGPPALIPPPKGGWSRPRILKFLQEELPADTLVGLDLGISLPFADCGAFFPGLDKSPADAAALWQLIDETCTNDAHLGAGGFVDAPQFAPYFRRHGGREGALFRCDKASHGRGRLRLTEHAQAARGLRPYSNFNLVGAAQVGKSSLTGMRMLHALRGKLPVWPIDTLPQSGSLVVEIYTALAAVEAGRPPGKTKVRDFAALDEALIKLGSAVIGKQGVLDDHSADALITAAWMRRAASNSALWKPPQLTRDIARTEGWTFGA
jgi:hypothetical protein